MINPFKNKKGLGRGLSSLIGDSDIKISSNKINIGSIVPNKNQPRKLFEKGTELWEKVDSRLVVDLRMFTMGGLAVLDSIESQGYDTWTSRPTVSKLKQLRMLIKSRKLWKEAHKKGRGMR